MSGGPTPPAPFLLLIPPGGPPRTSSPELRADPTLRRACPSASEEEGSAVAQATRLPLNHKQPQVYDPRSRFLPNNVSKVSNICVLMRKPVLQIPLRLGCVALGKSRHLSVPRFPHV